MYHFIINPKSRTGKGKAVWKVVQKRLEQLQIDYTYHYTHYEFHAIQLAKKICQEYHGEKYIIVIGGDGTVNEVINGISDFTDITLGYIPSGSSNDLARSLHIPKDPVSALEHILNGAWYQYFDHGCLVNIQKKSTRRFAESAGIGFDASICYEALHSKLKLLLNKLHLGKLTYITIAIKQLIKYQPVNGSLVVDGKRHFDLPNLFFVSTLIHAYEGGGLKVTPQANPTDGKISVCAIYNIKKWKAILIIPSLFFGFHSYFRGVKVFDCNTLEVFTEKPLLLHTDGEFAGRSNHIRVNCYKEQVRTLL